ncbi:MAG: GNAT family N-acetyltransferase, partial [Gammaproteobacteria bacterium]|nr:GNAT family N-acetyltransferase [Gammaproteobacteria bacterium]
AEALSERQRRMVVVAGDLTWCINIANCFTEQQWSNPDKTQWIAKEWPEPANRLQQIIGSETPLLIFNAHHGFDPNLFGAAAGTVVGGGLLLLLTPQFKRWSQKSDPVSSRISVYPHLPESLSQHYIERLIRTIEMGEKDNLLSTIQQGDPLEPTTVESPTPSHNEETVAITGTAEQRQAIDGILHTATGHRHRPLVLTADRGRGKSAALGIAAKALLDQGRQQIIVTAPSRSAVDNLFKHAGIDSPALEFVAPDALISQSLRADLVLVDEAAAIPTPILSKIVERYPRVVFATTTHGYEGSGQGFTLRFKKILGRLCPDYTEVKLRSPIRWAEGDPVEDQVNHMLLLDAEPELSESQNTTDVEPAISIDRIERLDRKQLAQNEPQLRQLFGLLVLAHYRTTPLDLRQLLDGPNLSIYTVTSHSHIIATALVANEGEIDADLTEHIWLGKRRPQGHLLPQTLIAHLGIKDAAPLRYRRIIRIAVHPQLQCKGVGHQLMDKITADAITEQVDLIGSSYGTTTELLKFWNSNHFTPLFIGGRRNASSGTYALTQMRPLSERGHSIQELAESRFQTGLVEQLREPLQQLEVDIVCQLLKPCPSSLNLHDWDDIDTFAHGNRRYETVLSPLKQLLLSHFDQTIHLTPRQRQLLIMKLLQNRSWSDCATLLNLDGKSATQVELRDAIAALIKSL